MKSAIFHLPWTAGSAFCRYFGAQEKREETHFQSRPIFAFGHQSAFLTGKACRLTPVNKPK
ncbi:MAG: hypothetical protein J6A70_00465 [Prevotella sp.]|nr:hypothetical protein [Prevotella sp.]